MNGASSIGNSGTLQEASSIKTMTETDKAQIEKLIEGELPWEELQNEVLPDPKDPDRFETTIEVLQEKVDWDERILVPLNDHLFVIASGSDQLVKGECGQVFCEVDENWKMECDIRVRESEEEMLDLYSKWETPDEDWTFQLREFFCPECHELVDVDAVPAGYPILKPFDPDIDVFYQEWLGQEVPEA